MKYFPLNISGDLADYDIDENKIDDSPDTLYVETYIKKNNNITEKITIIFKKNGNRKYSWIMENKNKSYKEMYITINNRKYWTEYKNNYKYLHKYNKIINKDLAKLIKKYL